MAKKKKKQKKAKTPIKHKPKARKKSAKKKFFSIDSKLTATKIHLYASTEEDLEGKTIKLDLTKSLRGRAFELKLKIKKSQTGLETEPLSMQLFQPYVKRIVRKGTDYVEDSFEVECKDGKMRVKPLLITRKRVSRSILNALRQAAVKHISAYIKSRDSKEIFSDITTNKLQKPLSLKLKKIYPLALCEIRAIKVLPGMHKPLEKRKSEDKEENQDSKEETEENKDSK